MPTFLNRFDHLPMTILSHSLLVYCLLFLACTACHNSPATSATTATTSGETSTSTRPTAPGGIRSLGTYPPASAGDLSGTVCTFRTGSHRNDAFSWSFDDSTFSLRGDAIPREALATLGLGAAKPKAITGTWSLRGQDVVLAVKTVDEQRTNVLAVAIPMMRTGPKILRLVIADDQFVFHD